ncbi:hypothetical protein LIER_09649 [Lithospermum erythrorhizon]|uniref:Uncharacterized protein n=1 Tax=Lithospermum erythrorhizon TaxID=34254 RepID=A0AAV3PGL6_LITER
MEISMKKVSLVLILVLVLIATEFSTVHCRTIKGSMEKGVNMGRIGCDEANPSSTGMDQFAVASSNNLSSGRTSLKGLGFKLASGPSKKGPGH